MKASPQQSGFSLIELLISLTIFTIVVTITTGTLLVLLDANAKAQNMQSVMTNLTFALDSMTRELRTGSAFACRTSADIDFNTDPVTALSDCSSGGNYLSVIESGGSLTGGGSPRIAYYYHDDEYGAGEGAIMRKVGFNSWQPITSRNVRITDMEFVVTGTSLSDTEQPSVTVFIEGEAGDIAGVDTAFSLQTSVSQRVIDI